MFGSPRYIGAVYRSSQAAGRGLEVPLALGRGEGGSSGRCHGMPTHMVRRYDTYRWSSGGLVLPRVGFFGVLNYRARRTSSAAAVEVHRLGWTGWTGWTVWTVACLMDSQMDGLEERVAQGLGAGATTITAYSGVAELPEPRDDVGPWLCTARRHRAGHGWCPWACSFARFGLADARQKRCSGRSTQGALAAPGPLSLLLPAAFALTSPAQLPPRPRPPDAMTGPPGACRSIQCARSASLIKDA